MDPRDKGYAVKRDAVMYWPAGTRDGSAGKLGAVSLSNLERCD
jgi:hypothetical protein